MHHFGQPLQWWHPSERLARPAVELTGNLVEIPPGVDREVGALGEVLTQETVGVLVGAALPRAARIAEVDGHAGSHRELVMLRHLGSLVPGDRLSQLGGELDDLALHRVAHLLGCRALDLQQHHEPRGSLDQRGDARVVRSHDQITLPVAWNRTVLDFGWALRDHDHPGDAPETDRLTLLGATDGPARPERAVQLAA